MNQTLRHRVILTASLLLVAITGCKTGQKSSVKGPIFASLAKPPLPVPGVAVSIGYSDKSKFEVWALKKLGQNPNKYYYASPAFPIAENMAIVPLRIAQENFPDDKGKTLSCGNACVFSDKVNSIKIGRGKNGDTDVFEVDIADLKGIVPGQEKFFNSRSTYNGSIAKPTDGANDAAVIYIKDPANYFKPSEIMPFSLNGVRVGQTLVTVDYRRSPDQELRATFNTQDSSDLPPGKSLEAAGSKTLGVTKVTAISRRGDQSSPEVKDPRIADTYLGNALFTEAVDMSEAPFEAEQVDRSQADLESLPRSTELGSFAMVYEDGAWRVVGFTVGGGLYGEPKDNILANVHNTGLGFKFRQLGLNFFPTGYDKDGVPNPRVDFSTDVPPADEDKGQDKTSDTDNKGPKDGGGTKEGGTAKR